MKKTRTYTVTETEGTPYIRLRGNWLRSYGLDYGSKLKLIEGKNMIVLIKIPDKKVEQEKRNKEIKALEKQVRFLKGAEPQYENQKISY